MRGGPLNFGLAGATKLKLLPIPNTIIDADTWKPIPISLHGVLIMRKRVHALLCMRIIRERIHALHGVRIMRVARLGRALHAMRMAFMHVAQVGACI